MFKNSERQSLVSDSTFWTFPFEICVFLNCVVQPLGIWVPIVMGEEVNQVSSLSGNIQGILNVGTLIVEDFKRRAWKCMLFHKRVIRLLRESYHRQGEVCCSSVKVFIETQKIDQKSAVLKTTGIQYLVWHMCILSVYKYRVWHRNTYVHT